MEISDILSIIAIVVSGLAFIVPSIVSIVHFRLERNRNRREATIHAFDELEENVFEHSDYKAFNDKEIDKCIKRYEGYGKKRETATHYLSRLEHFAVGVNMKTYDLNTVKRMAGAFIVEQYQKWEPLISDKRKRHNSDLLYCEFENLANSLKK